MPARLAHFLVSRGLLSAERAEEALKAQAVSGGALDTVLLEANLVPEADLLQAMGQASSTSPINLTEFEPNPAVAALLPGKIAERLGVVPLSVDGGTLHVGAIYPVKHKELEEVGVLLGKKIVPWVALEVRVRDWMSVLFKIPLRARDATLLAALDPDRPLPVAKAPAPAAAAAPSPETAEESAARQMVERAAAAVAGEPALPAPAPLPRGAPADTKPEPEPVLLDKVKQPARGVGKRVTQELYVSPVPAPVVPAVEPAQPNADWTLEDARRALADVQGDRERLKDVFLHFARGTFEFVAAFAIIRGTAVGWDAWGEGADAGQFGQVSIPLDSSSVFRTVALTRSSYVGPLPADGLSRGFLESFGRSPRTVFLYPIEVKSRIVAILYGDSGPRQVSQRRMSELLVFCQELPGAFTALIAHRKQRQRTERAAQFDFEPAPPPRAMSLGWGPTVPSSASGLGRAASLAALTHSEGERPPPDFAPLLRRLTGPDAAQRARAMAELARSPEASAKMLASKFPGPTAWARLPVVELPDADELGPISGALARLGRPAAAALAPLLDSEQSDTRYFALLAAGSLPYPDLLPGVLRGLFDLEPDISSAARVAAAALRHLPRFEAALRSLRQELAAMDPLRRSLAARALGMLHDREAVEGLIGLTGSEDALCAQAAAEALSHITRASFGTYPRQWTAWWAEHRGLRRSDWLVLALRNPDLELRLAAFEELSQAFGDTLGYRGEAPAEDREEATLRWEQAVVSDPRLRVLD